MMPLLLSRIALAIAFATSSVALAADPVGTTEIPTATKDVLVFKDSKETKTIDAAGRDVTINGGDNKLTITGQCHALTVSGDGNVVSVEAVSSIALSGGNNKVTWGKAVNGESPQVTNQGTGNTVVKAKGE